MFGPNLFVALVVALPASAQSVPKAEVSGGYQVLGVKNSDANIDETFGKGWYADLAGNIGRYFGVVGQVSGNYKTYKQTETFLGASSTYTADVRLHNFMGGVRVNARPNATVTPFGQFLVGGMNLSCKESGSFTSGGQTFFSSSSGDSSTDVGLQAGGGVFGF